MRALVADRSAPSGVSLREAPDAQIGLIASWREPR
jgi:hypothetical protein